MANETRSEAETPTPVKFWEQQLALADRDERDWRDAAADVIAKYRSTDRTKKQRFNILWSNTETLSASIGGEDPEPDIRRRNKQTDDVARQVSEVLERALSYTSDMNYDLGAVLDEVKLDMLLTGRGVPRVVYEPTVAERDLPVFDPLTGIPLLDAETGELLTETEEFMADQEVRLEYVVWDDYRQSPSKTQSQIWWRAFRHRMTRDELKEEFGEIGGRVPLTLNPDGLEDKNNKEAPHSSLGRAEVWEIWDKQRRKVYFLTKGFNEFLAVRDDPLGLRDFFPMPMPAYGVDTPGTEIPVPEYTLYEGLAQEADRLTKRIAAIVDTIKNSGAYDARFKDQIEELVNCSDNFYVGIDSWTEFMQQGGLDAVMQARDYSGAIQGLQVLVQEREKVTQQIFEITGISDVIRGASDPRETARAQTIKAQFGSMRLQKRQRRWAKMIRDAFRIKAEIIAEHYTPAILSRMTGMQVTDEMVQFMRNDKLRGYRIDVETDQTAFEDDIAERKSRAEFTQGFVNLMKEAVPAIQAAPPLGKVVTELVMFNVRAFKIGREMEETIEEAMTALANQPPKPPAPDPRMAKVQADARRDMLKLQMDGQMKQAELQQDQLEAASKVQLEQLKIQIDAILEARKQDLQAEARIIQ